MLPFEKSIAGRKILVTGHTGFKGGWLSVWLSTLGAEIHGISLEPDTSPNLFDAAGIGSIVRHNLLDIRDYSDLSAAITSIDPEIVFHLAAQPLVRRSYDDPLETFASNTLGTAHLLEACRHTSAVKAIVCVTTDKVYKNNNKLHAFQEDDELGGKDPYSASKAAAELVAKSFRESYFADAGSIAMATARGGNVIGGGDWSEDRLIPDVVRAISSDQKLTIRNPMATRPWQHALTLCHGYLQLADALLNDDERATSAWNFGPSEADTVPVSALLEKFGTTWKLPEIEIVPDEHKPESKNLMLDSTKARKFLDWNPAWSLDVAVSKTAEWYQTIYNNRSSMFDITRDQVSEYKSALSEHFG